MKAKYREILIYIVIIAVQILAILYWSNHKVNYHVDELYSMGYASNITGAGDTGQYITTSPDFEYDEWISNSKFKKHLIVSREERFLGLPAVSAVIRFFTQRNYIILLNIAESIADISYVSPKPGLYLNIVFFVVTELLLVLLMKKLEMDEKIRYLAVAMFGFSAYIISTAVYIRFYMLVIMMMIAMINLFYDMWKSDSWKNIAVSGVLLLLIAYLSYKDSELTVLFFAAFWFPFSCALIYKRKKRQLIACAAVVAAGMVYVITKTHIISVLLHPESYQDRMYIGINASENIRNVSAWTVKWYLSWAKGLFENQYFGSASMIVILAVAILAGLLFAIPTDTGITIYKPRIRRGSTDTTIFVLVILAEMILYTTFALLCEFAIWRYYCYGFVSGTIAIWYFIDRFVKNETLKYAKRVITSILAVFVVINALIPFSRRNIENIYEEEADFIEKVNDNDNLDVVLISGMEDGEISRHEIYDCVNIIPESSSIYIADIDQYENGSIPFPDEFILWTHEGRDVEKVFGDLKHSGFAIAELGSDHCSEAYVCSRK